MEPLAALTPTQKTQRDQLVASYTHHWKTHQDQGQRPPSSPSRVVPYLEVAADIVIRLRAQYPISTTNTTTTTQPGSGGEGGGSTLQRKMSTARSGAFRLMEGFSRQFLWACRRAPEEAPNAFVRALVHASCQDSRGYYPPLTAELVDTFVDRYFNSMMKQQLCESEQGAEIAMMEDDYDEDDEEEDPKIKDRQLSTQQAQLSTQQAEAPYVATNTLLTDIHNARDQLVPAVIKVLQQVLDYVHDPTENSQHNLTPVQWADLQAMIGKLKEASSHAKSLTENINPQERNSKDSQNAFPIPDFKRKCSKKAKGNKNITTKDINEQVDRKCTDRDNDGGEAKAQLHPEPMETEQIPETHQQSDLEPKLKQLQDQIPDPEPDKKSTSASREPVIIEPQQEQPPADDNTVNVAEDDLAAPLDDDDAVSESTNTKSESETDEIFVLNVTRVASDVDQLKAAIEDVLARIKAFDAAPYQDDPASGITVIESLQKNIMIYTEALMKDLLDLDNITVNKEDLGEEEYARLRAIRKEQVITVQKLMDELDQQGKSLNEFRRPLVEKLKVLEEKAALAAPANVEKKQPVQDAPTQQQTTPVQALEHVKDDENLVENSSAPSSSAQPNTSTAAENQDTVTYESMARLWEYLKLKPRFETAEKRSEYIIASNMPGLDKSNVQIRLVPDDYSRGYALEISGLISPDRNMFNALKRTALERAGYADEELILKLSHGMFGKFQEKFRLPPNADPDGVDASYAHDILQVSISKFPQQPSMRNYRTSSAAPGYANPFMMLQPGRGAYGPGYGRSRPSIWDTGDIFW